MRDERPARDLPLSMVTLLFGLASVPLALMRHLVSLSLVLAMLALAFRWWGMRSALVRDHAPASLKRSSLGGRAAAVGAVTALAMWMLWRTNVLLH
jgi:hypothetical protein